MRNCFSVHLFSTVATFGVALNFGFCVSVAHAQTTPPNPVAPVVSGVTPPSAPPAIPPVFVKPTPVPYPTPVIVQSEVATADLAIDELHVSVATGSIHPSAKLVQSSDPIAVTNSLLLKILKRGFPEMRNVAPKDIRIVLAIYGLGEVVAKTLVRLQQAGFNVTVITDANRSLDADFGDGSDSSTDYGSAVLKDNETARAQTILTKNNHFKFGTNLFTQPLQNDDHGTAIITIMHLKEMTVQIKDQPYLLLSSTGNLTNVNRVNQTYLSHDVDLIKFNVGLLDDTIATFAKNGQIADIPQRPPLRIVYKDGTFAEQHITYKGANPYDRVIQLMSDPNFKIDRLLGDEFLITYGRFVYAVKDALDRNPGMQVNFLLDTSFLKGYGVGQVMGGYPAYLPYGKTMDGFSKAERGTRVNTFVYQRPTDKPVTVLNGSPDNQFVNHTKTLVIEGVLTDPATGISENVVYVVTQSFNVSNHVVNEETLGIFKLKAGGSAALAYHQSIADLIATDPFVVSMDVGMMRINLAALFQRSEFEISKSDAIAFQMALRSGNVPVTMGILHRINSLPTHIVTVPAPGLIDGRVARFQKLMEWVGAQTGAASLFKMFGPQRSVQMVMAAAGKDGVAVVDQVTELLKNLAWKPNITPDELTARVAQLNAILAAPEDMPAPLTPMIMQNFSMPVPSPLLLDSRGFVKDPLNGWGKSTRAVSNANSVNSSIGPNVSANVMDALSSAPLLNVVRPGTFAQVEQSVSLPAAPTAQNLPTASHFVFDIDATLFNLGTSVYIFDKKTGTELKLSQDDYQTNKKLIGKSGPYKNYQYTDHSYKDYAVNIAGQIEATHGNPAMLAPAFPVLVTSLSDPLLAQDTFISTGRDGAVDDLEQGFVDLKNDGVLLNVPPARNLILGGSAVFNPSNLPTDQFKAMENLKLMTTLRDQPESFGQHRRFYFFDDSHPNIVASQAATEKAMASSPDAWKNFDAILIQVSPSDWTFHSVRSGVPTVILTIDMTKAGNMDLLRDQIFHNGFDCDLGLGGPGSSLSFLQ
jgi:hypothetical protein